MKIIDLTFPIREGHYRWPVEKYLKNNFEPGANPDLNTVISRLGSHYFTHCDSEKHFVPDERYVYDVPLSQWIGPAALVDLSHLGPRGAVSAKELEEHGQHVKEGDIVILYTDWPRKANYLTPEFWADSPYTTADACQWLIDRKVKTVCYDYSPDDCIRYEVTEPGHPNLYEDFTTHYYFFPKNILVIEYLCNLHLINQERFFFVGLPLAIDETEGAATRCIALLDVPADVYENKETPAEIQE